MINCKLKDTTGVAVKWTGESDCLAGSPFSVTEKSGKKTVVYKEFELWPRVSDWLVVNSGRAEIINDKRFIATYDEVVD